MMFALTQPIIFLNSDIYITIPCFILCAKTQMISLRHVSDSLIFVVVVIFKSSFNFIEKLRGKYRD